MRHCRNLVSLNQGVVKDFVVAVLSYALTLGIIHGIRWEYSAE